MPLTISNNSAVSSASYYLDKNQKNLQNSIKRLASGKKIVGLNEDPGTLSVVMKLNKSQPIVRSQEQCAKRYLICGDTGRRTGDRGANRRTDG